MYVSLASNIIDEPLQFIKFRFIYPDKSISTYILMFQFLSQTEILFIYFKLISLRAYAKRSIENTIDSYMILPRAR